MAIYEINSGRFVISSGGMWLNGSYDSERAARYAFRFSDEDLLKLQKEKNWNGQPITFNDLRNLKKEKSK